MLNDLISALNLGRSISDATKRPCPPNARSNICISLQHLYLVSSLHPPESCFLALSFFSFTVLSIIVPHCHLTQLAVAVQVIVLMCP